jgi:hypothetical protein
MFVTAGSPALLRPFLLLLCLLMLAACASPAPRERRAARLAEFQAVAGAPVASFHFWELQRWELLGPQHVAVWTRVNEAWLIEVERGCYGLEFAEAIGLTSSVNRVSRRLDAVRFGQQRCQIREIWPIDGKALKAGRS